MRVLMTTDTVGGVWTFTRELTEGLLQQVCSVMLVSFGREPSADQRAWADSIAQSSPERFHFVPTAFALEWMQGNASFFRESADLLRRLAAEFRADLLHSNQLCYGTLSALLPTVVTVHSDVRSWFRACRATEPELSPWIERYDQLVRPGLCAADIVAAPTAWMLREAEQDYGPFRRAAVVPNGREVAPAASPTERTMQAVTAGRLWDEAKDLALLRDVASPVPLLVAGEQTGPDTATTISGQHIIYLGPLSKSAMLDLFHRSAIYVVTSRYEPFGLAPLEAALCGCAIIARDLASLREVWGDAALYFRTVAELSAILHSLSHDTPRGAELARKANDRARQFGREPMTTRYRALYTSAVQDRAHTERHVA